MQQVKKSDNKKPVQIYFPMDLYLGLKNMADQKQLPLATMLREISVAELTKFHKKRKKLSDMPTFDMPGLDPNMSENLDPHIYDLS